jgi:autotransporter adhesin
MYKMTKHIKRIHKKSGTRRVKRGGVAQARMQNHMAAINGLIGAVENAKSEEDRQALEASLNAHNKAVMALRNGNIDNYNHAAAEAANAQPAAARAVMNHRGGKKMRKNKRTVRKGTRRGGMRRCPYCHPAPCMCRRMRRMTRNRRR